MVAIRVLMCSCVYVHVERANFDFDAPGIAGFAFQPIVAIPAKAAVATQAARFWPHRRGRFRATGGSGPVAFFRRFHPLLIVVEPRTHAGVRASARFLLPKVSKRP
jgi:hypothetical protein